MTTIPAPTITAVGVTDSREVSVALADTEPMTLPPGYGRSNRTFRPDRLDLRWTNGTLYRAQLTGPKLKVDGTPYATLNREGVSYIDDADRGYEGSDGRWVYVPRSGLSPDAPEWVRQLVEEHAPA